MDGGVGASFGRRVGWGIGVVGGGIGGRVSLAVATNVLAALTGSASGGLTIALDALGGTYLRLASEHGIDPALLHRVAVMSAGTLDSLPHNGAVVTLLAVCGVTHSDSYKDIFVVAIVGAFWRLPPSSSWVRSSGRSELGSRLCSQIATRAMLAICTTILVAAALYFGRSIFAPLAFAIFMVAIVWPLQRALETKLPQAVALLLTLLLTLAVVVAVSSMVTWALSVERAWLVGHAARFQTIYAEWARWLEEHEIFVVGPLTERST